MRLVEFKTLLTERVVNLHNNETKLKYGQQVWDVLQKSYENIGGFRTASSLEELMVKSAMWKIVIRHNHVSAVQIYRDQFGRKSIALGSDGTRQGKLDAFMMLNENVKMGRSWSEVSGAVEKLVAKLGMKPIPSQFAELLTKHNILSYNPDGFHYSRFIEGHPHEKIMYGTCQLNHSDIKKLKDSGLEFHKWPEIFKIK